MIGNLVVALCALFVGYGIGLWRRSKRTRRCPSLREWRNEERGHGGLWRCNQDKGHEGPHGALGDSYRQHWWLTIQEFTGEDEEDEP